MSNCGSILSGASDLDGPVLFGLGHLTGQEIIGPGSLVVCYMSLGVWIGH